MRKTVQVINGLEREGVISGYALGGATALLFYTEPQLTFDVDVFILIPACKDKKGLIDLGPLYAHLKSEGYHAEKEHVMIGGIPVQFLPAYSPLIESAVRHAEEKEYDGVPVKVVALEYLMAIMIDTNRPKDRERIFKLLDEKRFDKKTLVSILDRYSLRKKWRKYIEKK